MSYRYRVYRNPPFPDGFVDTNNHYLVDSMNVCGDGIKGSDEQCDDGNLYDGDGCSQQCTVEEKFNCIQENKCMLLFSMQVIRFAVSPSLCYIYEGDGECEHFEHDRKSRDCSSVSSANHRQYYPTSVYAYSSILRKNCSLQMLSSATLTLVSFFSKIFLK
ncbi:unnamed protein product [Gongylonema pulchrum]|uniref:DUF4215 domain-containing protein n=1 Tax=Gongylonema pulchrum TaxID=637853 RepID=A0A3P6R0N3_9BILA|nr:unnamed protein product [Gongylonema pulchrum]